MKRDEDIVPVELAEEEHEAILTAEILPAWTRDAVPQDRPVVVVVAGPAGSGKSHLCDLLLAVLNRRGGAVLIGRDLYKRAHPHYADLMRSDDRTAGVRTRPDVLRWQAEVEEYARSRRFDVVLEEPVADVEEACAKARSYRADGYRVELVALATAEAEAQLSSLDRYLTQVAEEGVGRYVSPGNFDRCARNLPRFLQVVEAERLAHQVMVARRGLQVLYLNKLTDEGAWQRVPAAAQTLTSDWARPWTVPQTWAFRRQLSGAEQRLHPSLLTAERRLAVAGGLERAFGLAERVRRIAQPLALPPGVDYHRLSPSEHTWIFDELIVPMYLSNITPQDAPVTLYVMGPQGSGKSYTARMLRRALRQRRPTRIEGGLFKMVHPDYRRLLDEHPRTASARIRADYRQWQEMAEAYVRAHRGDMLIEIAPDSVAHFIDGARRHHREGRRVELVVIGARAADSRLGTATRCAEVARLGGNPRLTEAAAHQRTFQVVPDVVRAAELSPYVHCTSVIRRDLTAVYRNARLRDGSWGRAPRGGDVLEAEQHRPYTAAEATQVIATLRRLKRELPQYRSDLVDIAALAWPLMPAHVRPRILSTTITTAPLSLPQCGYWPPSSWERAV
ncbi:zeta toxin family protein (plasmid) [Streptomyces sp. NBC_01298]|uniref:zeta toxin family protein n=1 Tax=Streptomyces sp. NBC_01298 TaxID=2903817 RepID=UPI002E11186D|nr:zeta toxin family protein [Streptomyces sp. NBC_01298]